jgi:hypothetical protein
MWRGQPAVVGGQVLRREDVRCLRSAQDNVDAAGGGSARSGIAKALAGGRRSFSSTLQRHCFDDAMGWPGLEGGVGARGAAAQALKAQRHSPVDGGTVR